jgi:TPR repeat protein
MNTRPSIAALLALAVSSARAARGLEDAMAAFDRGGFVEAEGKLLVAAHNGNAHAQEMLGFLYAIGPDLYPGVWRNLLTARLWFERAARNGRPAAAYMHVAFMRRGTVQVRADIMACFDQTVGSGHPPPGHPGTVLSEP